MSPLTRIYAIVALLALATSLTSNAASADLKGDEIATAQGPLIIHPVFHASIVMAWDNKIIDFDPVGGSQRYGDLPKPDIIFITHIHPDHLDLKTLALIDQRSTKLVVPQSVFDKLPDNLQKQARIIGNGEMAVVDGIKVEAIAMYNLPDAGKRIYHPKGLGNGYVLTLGGKRIYISGDTDGTPEMRALKDIDVAFICMNPPYTMPVEQAADAVLAFTPKIVYPYHYRSPTGLNDIGKFKDLVSTDKSIEVRIRDWYPHQ